MYNFIITGLLVVCFIWLFWLNKMNKYRLDDINTLNDDINTLYNNQATAAQATLTTVKNNVSSAIKEASESTKAELVNIHKALITKAAAAHKKEMQNRTLELIGQTVELTGKVRAFEQHTNEYFKENLDDHLTKAESRIDALENKKDELEICIYSELSDLREFERKIITTLNQIGIVFNKLPDSDSTFDFYVCERIGTIYKVPKKFDHWKAQLETVEIDRMNAAVYIEEDSKEEIKIPIPLLTHIQNPEPRKEQIETSSSIQTSDQETTDLLTCPVCENEFTSLQYTLQHIEQKQDEEHRKYRAENPGYADHLIAAIEEENHAPRITD